MNSCLALLVRGLWTILAVLLFSRRGSCPTCWHLTVTQVLRQQSESNNKADISDRPVPYLRA